MSQIAIVHPNLMQMGGGEAVAVNVIESLQDRHEVTVFTRVEPDISLLNSYYKSSIGNVDISVIQSSYGLSKLSSIGINILSKAIFYRSLRGNLSHFDLVMNTADEFPLGNQSVVYVHFPRFSAKKLPDRDTRSGLSRKLVIQLSRQLAGFSQEKLQSAYILTNSSWTADVINEVYGVDPIVSNPPINKSGLKERECQNQCEGFVTIGRIRKEKNIVRSIEIIDLLIERGFDTHLHIIGPTTNTKYYNKVKNEANKRDYVHLEGKISREELTKMISMHKYGLHGKNDEHFGIAVAEMVSSGSIVFVPAGGGQQELVGNNKDLIYISKHDAAEKITKVLSMNGAERRELKNKINVSIPDEEQFQETVRKIIEDRVL